MANSIRNILTIYGAPDEADRFVGRFLRGGLTAFMPIPPDANPARKYSETWGACPEGYDLEILTADSIASVEFSGEDHTRPHLANNAADNNWLNYNQFTLADHQADIRSCDLPGFLGQDMKPVALIVFYTKWQFPCLWIESVINAEYDHGLVLHMHSYDVMANNDYPDQPHYPDDDCGGEGCKHFHSYTSTDGEYLQSGHCAILIRMVHGSRIAMPVIQGSTQLDRT
jgi:hypothetical protein